MHTQNICVHNCSAIPIIALTKLCTLTSSLLFTLAPSEINNSIIGASLSKPHTSEKFGTVVTYANNYEKKQTISVTTTGKSERFPYFIDTIVHVAKDNKHSLLTLFTICLDVHVAKNNKCLVGTVVRVAENNDLSLRSCHKK